MTMDKSLRLRVGMIRARNVLTRDERIARLLAADRWQEGDSPFGLAKVRVYKLAIKKKKKKKKEDEKQEGKGLPPRAAPAAKAAGKPAAKLRPRSSVCRCAAIRCAGLGPLQFQEWREQSPLPTGEGT